MGRRPILPCSVGQALCPWSRCRPRPIDQCPACAYCTNRADGWMIAGGNFRGKSGLHEVRVPGNARRGQPQGKRHREESALVSGASPAETLVMVKRWGKSPPRTGQPGRYGKPHPEQCRIGALRGKVRTHTPATGCRRPPQGHFSPKARVGSLTALVTGAAEEWSSRGESLGQNPAYRPSAQSFFSCWHLAGPQLSGKVPRALPRQRLIRRPLLASLSGYWPHQKETSA